MDDCCRLVLPYNAVHSIQQTGQIPNDPPQMGAKSTTTSNHPSTPVWGVFRRRADVCRGRILTPKDNPRAEMVKAEIGRENKQNNEVES